MNKTIKKVGNKPVMKFTKVKGGQRCGMNKTRNNSTSIEIGGRNGGVKYQGKHLGRDLGIVGLIVGVIGIGYYGVKNFIGNKKSSNKMAEDNNKSKNQIDEHHEASQDSMNEDDNKTDNKIRLLKAQSAARVEERKIMYDLAQQYSTKTAQGNSTRNESLSAWIEAFDRKYPMPDTSNFEVLHSILSGCPDGYEPAMLFHLLSQFGSLCFSRVRAMYLDNKLHSPNIQVVIEGKKGSGKGKFTTTYKVLFERVIDLDSVKMSSCSQDLIIQTSGINVTAATFYEVLAHNRGVHMYAYESEMSTVQDIFGKKGSLTPSILRMAFDNDCIFQNNKAKDSVKGRFPVFMNYTFTGTPDSISRFFTAKEEEGGTARRQCFSVIPELGVTPPTQSLPTGSELEMIRNTIDMWREKYCYQTKDGRDCPCNEYKIDMDYVCEALRDWGYNQVELSKKDGITARNELRLGLATVAFHCAIVLHMLAGEPAPNERAKRKAVKNMALYVANYLMERYITKFCNVAATMPESLSAEEPVQPQKRKLTQEEIEYWYPLKGTPDEFGNVIGLGTIAKRIGTDKNTVHNAFMRYEKQLKKGCA